MNIVICIDLDLFLYIWTAWPSQLRCCIICKYHSAWLGAPSHSPAPRLCSLVDCSFFQHQKLNTRIQSYLLRQFHRHQSSILRPQWIASPSAPNLNGRLLNLNGRSNRRQSWVIHCVKTFNWTIELTILPLQLQQPTSMSVCKIMCRLPVFWNNNTS